MTRLVSSRTSTSAGRKRGLAPFWPGYVYQKVINGTQHDLLLETAVYRRMTEKEWAASRGVAYATARNSGHRAEAAIQEYEKAERERRAQQVLE